MGVASVAELTLEAMSGRMADIDLTAASFTDMSRTYPGFVSLNLKLRRIRSLSGDSLEGLAASLQRLTIRQTSISELPSALLAKLTGLRNLTVYLNKNLYSVPGYGHYPALK